MELKFDEFKIKTLFINMLLKQGKKTCSEHIFKNILINLKKITKQKPTFILITAIQNLLPKLKAISIPNKKRKKKKKDSYFLMLLDHDKQIKKSIAWLLLNSLSKNRSTEIIQTAKNKSKTINTKKQYYKNIKKLKFNLIFD